MNIMIMYLKGEFFLSSEGTYSKNETLHSEKDRNRCGVVFVNSRDSFLLLELSEVKLCIVSELTRKCREIRIRHEIVGFSQHRPGRDGSTRAASRGIAE